jgi:hypothetical protein
MPFVPLTGDELNNTPLHVVALIALIAAVGLTVTVQVNVAFTPHKDDVGVTIYVAVCVLFVGLLNVPVNIVAPLPVVPPVIPPVTLGALQLYVVPAGTIPLLPLVGVALNKTPLHPTAVIALITALGLTVTVKVNVPFTPHNVEVGVIVYVAVCVVFVGLVKVPVNIVAPLPVVPPVNPPVTLGALQLYVVPAGTIPLLPLVGVALNKTPLHPTAVIALITALGLTVTVTANVAPVQLPDNGVTV